MNDKRTLLITGASGFFGGSVLRALQAEKYPGRIIAVTSREYSRGYPGLNLEWVRADLMDPSSISKLIASERPEVLIHLAWFVSHGEFWRSEKNHDWVKASVFLFSEFAKNGGKKFIGAGTMVEYDIRSGDIREDSTPLTPTNLYGKSKKDVFDSIVEIRNRIAPELSILWPRIGFFFGEEESPTKLISKLISAIRTDSPMDLLPAETGRPYAHVDHFGRVLTSLLGKDVKTIAFNVSGPKMFSFGEIAEFIAKSFGKTTKCIRFGAYKTPESEPVSQKIGLDRLKGVGIVIPDTFFEDLGKMIREKSKV